eukprot:TRINITY_DN18013_c3_g1_i1.p1 TRINITY_DN18013_c3_g1~~TRINITY_DN18013_c3_g1_i1.p1  ORF type:complete len:336 (-),score=40.38 TRINITY_DN18013_c3_g1_i1:98-1024(-)
MATDADIDDSRQVSAPTLFGGSTELIRSLVATLLLTIDLCSTVQDWDLPSFKESLDVEAPVLIMGTFSPELHLSFKWIKRCPRLESCYDRAAAGYWWLKNRLGRLIPPPDFFQITIRGKWIQYGPLLCVMMIDLCYTRSQVMYDPANFGQYTDDDDFIWAITDQAYLDRAYTDGVLTNSSLITYAARWNVTTGSPLDASAATDVKLNSRYTGAIYKYLSILLGTSVVVLFFSMLWIADREATIRDQEAQEACVQTEMHPSSLAEQDSSKQDAKVEEDSATAKQGDGPKVRYDIRVEGEDSEPVGYAEF